MIPTVTSGSKSDQGIRDTMEDTHKQIDDARNNEFKSLESFQLASYYGVFDGHGGVDTAIRLESLLHPKVFQLLDNNDVANSIKNAYESVDGEIVTEANEKNWSSGSTAVSSLILDNVLYTANLGDSEAILISEGSDGSINHDVLTYPHKASDSDERNRIVNLGGHVFFGRVFGALAVSRSFGDTRYKKPKTSQNFVSYEPYITRRELNNTHKALILACDGLWDVVKYDDVSQFVISLIKQGKNADQISNELVKRAIDNETVDNVTVVTILFNWGNNQ